MSLLQPYCLAFVLALAAQIGWSFAVGFGVSFYEELRRNDPDKRNWSESLRYTRSGEAVIQRREWTPAKTVETFLRAEDRRPIDKPNDLLPEGYALVGQLQKPNARLPHGFDRVFPARIPGDQEVYLVYADGSHRRGYFEVFDRRTRRRLGYVGSEGWSETQPTAEQQLQLGTVPRYYSGGPVLSYHDLESLGQNVGLSGESIVPGSEPFLSSQAVVLHGESLLLIDFVERTVQPLTPDLRVEAITLVWLPQGKLAADEPVARTGELRPYIAARAADRIALLHPRSGQGWEIPLPAEVTDASLSLTLLPDQSAIIGQSERELPYPQLHRDLWWIERSGRVTRRETVRLDVQWYGVPIGDAATRNFICAAAGAPLSTAVLCLTVRIISADEPSAPSYAEVFATWVRAAWPTMLLILLVGVACGWAVDRFRQSRRLPRSWGWIVFGFLLGIPGLFGFLLHRSWPIVKPAPPPVRLGTEVMA